VGGLVVGGVGGYLAGAGSSSSGGAIPPAGGGGGGTTTSKPLVLGSGSPVTDIYAGDGQEMIRGQTMAIEEINQRGGLLGRQLKLSILDTKAQQSDVMANVFRHFVSQGVAAIFSGYCTYDSKEFDVVAPSGLPTFHVNTWQGNLDYVKAHGYINVFEGDPSEKWYGPGFIIVAENLMNSGAWTPAAKSLAVVTSNDPYSLSIAQSFRTGMEAKGWTTNLFQQFTAPQADWTGVLTQIRQNPPGIIFFSDYDPGDEASFMKQFRTAPTRSLVYQQYAPSVPQYLELAGAAANGVVWSTVIGTITTDSYAQDFIQRYTNRFGQHPGLSNAGGQYDLVRLWAHAVEEVGDPYAFSKVNDAVARSIFRGVSGAFTFVPGTLSCPPYPDQVSDPSLGMPHLTFQIQNGQQVLISPQPYVGGQFQLPDWLK
jgi:branched-chain amino acid transport system substrate-binding protein